jgi:hypothetical protein
MSVKTLLILMLALFLSPMAFSDEEMAPYSYIVASQSGRHYFKMFPGSLDGEEKGLGHGGVYQVGHEDNKDTLLWTVDGWYAFKTFLSNDTEFLVRIGNWPRGHKPSEKDLGIAFYKKGVLIKSYSTKDLIKDESKVSPSMSHYEFYKGELGFDKKDGKTFEITTVDDIKYSFTVETGSIIQKK